MAKNWYDSAAPTMELGGLLGMPDMRLTDEDKKRAFWQALMQGGMGMAAASLGGANTAQSLGKGLLGGADAYGQGLQAPMARFNQAKEQLDFQGKQLGNAKNYAELQQQQNLQRLLGGVGNVTANPFQMEANGNGASGIGPLAPDSPEMQQGAMQAQAALFNNPAFLSKLAANGMKGSDISALGGRFDPQQRQAGSYYQDPITKQNQYYASLPQGMMIQNGKATNADGYTNAMQDRTLSEKAAEAVAELLRRKGIDPMDVKKAGDVAGAEAGARDAYGFTQAFDDQGRPVLYTNQQARGKAQNAFPGARIDPQVQAQRDAVAQGIYDAEGAGKYSPRLNDSPGGGVRPQVAGLPGIRGQSPSDAAEQKGIREVLVNDVYKPAQLASSKSSTLIPLIDRQLSLINQGTLIGNRAQPVMNTIRSWAQASGLSDAETNNILNSATEFRQFANKAVLNGPRMEGPQSDKDRVFYTESNAQIQDPTQAIKQSLAYAKAENERNVEYRRFIDSHLQKGGSLQDVRAQWENGPGAKSVWEHPKLKEFLPTVIAQSGPYKGRQMVQLPDGRFTLR